MVVLTWGANFRAVKFAYGDIHPLIFAAFPSQSAAFWSWKSPSGKSGFFAYEQREWETSVCSAWVV